MSGLGVCSSIHGLHVIYIMSYGDIIFYLCTKGVDSSIPLVVIICSRDFSIV